MTRRRVLVIEHQQNAGLGQLAARLSDNGWAVDTVGPDVGRPVPGDLAGYDALVVLGGAMGPLEDALAPWLPATRALLASAVAQEVPTLGICLGAQLLATVSGGHVRTMPEGPEVGLETVTFADAAASDPIFADLSGKTMPVVQWHWLEADRLPEGASVLASSAGCSNQVFRIGAAAWGVQFHPEALGATASDWAEEDQASLDALGLAADDVVGRVFAAEPQLRAAWLPIVDRFTRVAERGLSLQR